MGIPEFGIKRENEERRDGGCAVIFNPETKLFAVGKRDADGRLLLFGGGVDAGEDIEQGVLREVREEGGLYDFLRFEKLAEALTHYHNIAKNVDRIAHATCYLAVLRSTATVPTQHEAHEQFSLAWASAAEMLAHWKARNAEQNFSHWLYFLEKATTQLAALGYELA